MKLSPQASLTVICHIIQALEVEYHHFTYYAGKVRLVKGFDLSFYNSQQPPVDVNTLVSSWKARQQEVGRSAMTVTLIEDGDSPLHRTQQCRTERDAHTQSGAILNVYHVNWHNERFA